MFYRLDSPRFPQQREQLAIFLLSISKHPLNHQTNVEAAARGGKGLLVGKKHLANQFRPGLSQCKILFCHLASAPSAGGRSPPREKKLIFYRYDAITGNQIGISSQRVFFTKKSIINLSLLHKKSIRAEKTYPFLA